MGDDHQQEGNLLLPLLPALLIVPILAVLGVEPLDLGFAAILAPLLMFPIVLLAVSYTHLTLPTKRIV